MTITYPKSKKAMKLPDGDSVLNSKNLRKVKGLFFKTTIDSRCIERETEKAIFVKATNYSSSFFDGDDTVFDEIGFWLPKSLTFVDDGKICTAGFLVREKGLFVICE